MRIIQFFIRIPKKLSFPNACLPARQAFPPKADQPQAEVGNPVEAILGPPTKTFGGDSFKIASSLLIIVYYILGNIFSLEAQTSKTPNAEEDYYEELKKEYVPQDSPQKSFLLELKLLSDGMYCYDLPLFDPQWRRRGKKILTSPAFADTAKKANQPLNVYIDGQYAVIYFPHNKDLSPVFLYHEDPSGWIIDRSAVSDKIIYDKRGSWLVLGGEYPYLNLLKKIYSFEGIPIDDNGLTGYEPKGFNPTLDSIHLP